ncbi:MAG: cytochrome c assembly protein, partial [Bacteroidota bacterium]
PMSGYEVTYMSDTLEGFTRTFEINFKQRNEAGEVTEDFNVYPNVLYSKDFTKIEAPNPDTKHYLHKDIFTHVANLPKVELDKEYAQAVEDSLNYVRYNVSPSNSFSIRDTIPLRDKDTTVVRSYSAELVSIDRNPSHPDYHAEVGDITIGAHLKIHTPDSTFDVRPMLALRGQMLYSYPDMVKPMTMKAKLDEGVFDQILFSDKDLDYELFTLKQGEAFQYKGYSIQFGGFNRNPIHRDYQKEEGDIAVGAMINVSDGERNYTAAPIYFIRGNRPYNIKDMVEETGLHVRFNSIDPKTESVELLLAKQETQGLTVPVDIATNAARTDFIVFEAIEFQGINLFWIGSTAMMLGFFFSLVVRWRSKVEMEKKMVPVERVMPSQEIEV